MKLQALEGWLHVTEFKITWFLLIDIEEEDIRYSKKTDLKIIKSEDSPTNKQSAFMSRRIIYSI